MGKKKAETESKQEVKEEPKEEEKEEDSPVVKELKEVDDQYLALEREYEKAVQELQKQFTAKQQPFLDKRKQILTDVARAQEDDAKSKGTPGLSGFWLKALKRLPATEDQVEEHDEDVLEYCSDITKSFLDEDVSKGFKITFSFVENPYFTNSTIEKEYHTKEACPYSGEIKCTEIKATEIDWKDGKDVTVEKVTKKVKGGGAKKAKQKAKESVEPRDSFFRNFFRNLQEGGELPDDMNLEEARGMCDDEGDDEEMIDLIMENDYEIGTCVRDSLIPFAVRYYTGEAGNDYDDIDFDEDDEEDDEDDEDDEESDDEPAAKGKAKKAGGKAGGKGKQAEECKQQ
eukprot:TRINITY_DN873_c0_g1_i1.p1 TRINITY_DN873_c0_g1~~TRINITY_DN873_c0_g1_i1.p1  ORF type:complete len:343 (+),score=138.91 TRINITY_DN873_c0_g1_i1:107-1135(+)